MTSEAPSLSDASIDRLIDQLWDTANKNGHGQNSVYAILDGAQNTKIEPMINNSRLPDACLFSGKLSYAMRRAAPHVVQLEKRHPFTRDIIRMGWGKHWGIFVIVEPDASLARLRGHCRRIAKVTSPQNTSLVFRYYDPRILWEILPVCSESEQQMLLGPISYAFAGIGSEDHWQVLYRREQDGKLLAQDLSTTPEIGAALPYQRFSYGNGFQLRQAHMDVFEKKADVEFFKEVYQDYLQVYEDNPNKTFTINEHRLNLISYLWQCYSKATQFKLTDGYSLMVFFNLCSQHGWQFWEQEAYAWIKDILLQERPAEARIEQIEKQASAQLMERLWS